MKHLRAHPDYVDPPVPQQASVDALRLEVLGPDITAEDYEAVMESADKLEGLFGDSWPRGLTLEENTIDLAWHLREFEAARSFRLGDPRRRRALSRLLLPVPDAR